MAGAWKVAYADFVTAMMAFFLLLWVLSTVSPETKAGLAAYFKGELQYDSSATSPVSNNPFLQNTARISTDSLRISENEKSHIAIAQKLQQMLMADAIPQSASGISADDVGVQLRVNSDESLRKTSCFRAERAAPLAADTLLRADRSTDRIFRAIATLHAIRSLFLPSNGGLGSSICAHCLENSATMEGSSLDASWPWNGHRRTVPSVARSRFREYFSTSQG